MRLRWMLAWVTSESMEGTSRDMKIFSFGGRKRCDWDGKSICVFHLAGSHVRWRRLVVKDNDPFPLPLLFLSLSRLKLDVFQHVVGDKEPDSL